MTSAPFEVVDQSIDVISNAQVAGVLAHSHLVRSMVVARNLLQDGESVVGRKII
jgi:hypothetical protein